MPISLLDLKAAATAFTPKTPVDLLRYKTGELAIVAIEGAKKTVGDARPMIFSAEKNVFCAMQNAALVIAQRTPHFPRKLDTGPRHLSNFLRLTQGLVIHAYWVNYRAWKSPGRLCAGKLFRPWLLQSCVRCFRSHLVDAVVVSSLLPHGNWRPALAEPSCVFSLGY